MDVEGNTDTALKEALKASEAERIKLANMLREVEGKLDLVLRNVSEIIYTLDDNGLITFINDGIRNFGFAPHELIGLDIFQIVHPDDRDRAVYHVNERRSGERGTKAFEVRLIAKPKDSFSIPNLKAMERKLLFSLNAEGQWAAKNGHEAEFIGTIGIAKPKFKIGAEVETLMPEGVKAAEKEDTSLIPICANCKSIRMNTGEWKSIETFLRENGELSLTHTICHKCIDSLYPGLDQ